MFLRLKLMYKVYFNKPIYIVDVLNFAKTYKQKSQGLCYCIIKSLRILLNLDIRYCEIKNLIPLFGKNVSMFNGNTNYVYWWTPKVWDDRSLYLDWLISAYRKDKTDLRKVINHTN